MEQHPVPQQITSYQFRLVGDMTLKQFFQVAGGGLIALLIYATNLPVIIKWPIMIIFVLLGIALAFLPFQERPLEDWIIAFFRAIYMPTSYTWAKAKKPRQYFQPEQTTQVKPTAEEIVTPYGKTAMETYLKTPADEKQTLVSKLEEAEKEFLSRTLKLFKHEPVAGDVEQKQQVVPLQTVSVKPQVQQAAPQPVTPTPPPITSFPSQPVSKIETVQQKPAGPPKPKVIAVKPPPTVPEGKVSAVNQAASTITPLTHKPSTPTAPTIQNTISGQVIDNHGKIVEGAILEVKDSAGRPVRALKSNKVGHFLTVTPLLNGMYEIVSEKEGLTFVPITFEAKGKIIPPITIQAQSSILPAANVAMSNTKTNQVRPSIQT